MQLEYVPSAPLMSAEALRNLRMTVDSALGVPIDHPLVSELREYSLSSATSDQALSHMNDTYTSKVLLVCFVVVKAPSDSHEEAEIRLSAWLAAHSAFLSSKNASRTPLPLQIGWIARGFRWSFYICHQSQVDGSIEIWGPSPVIIGTDGHRAAMAVLSVLRAQLRWVTDRHLPVFEDIIRTHYERNALA